MHIRSAALCLTLSLALPALARADLPAPELREARRQLRSYDLNGGTAGVLRDLSRFLEQADGADRREARFLRAAAAADLVILARGRALPTLRAQVAEALGVSAEALEPWLAAELSRVSFGAYAPMAEQGRWALRVLADPDAEPRTLRDGRGERRDMLYVHAVVDALGAEEPIARLAPFGVDPCVGAGACELAMFTAPGRRAVEALREANAALSRLERVAEAGEPLAAAMAALVAADGALLRTATIHPTPRLDDRAAVPLVGALGRPVNPELLVLVEPTRVRYAYVPAARVRGEAVEIVSPRSPALPHWASVPLCDDHRAAVVPIEPLQAHFAALQAESPHGAVGLAATAEVGALLVSRALVSLQRAGLPTPALVGRGPGGEARGLGVRVVDEDARAALSLYVRHGGYSLHRGGRLIDLPRVRDDRGLHFDLAGLEARARAFAPGDAALRFMSTLEWGHVLDAAFRLQPDPSRELLLQLR